MRWLDRLHRWTGGLIGVILALLGLTGTLLLWKSVWITVPGKDAALMRDPVVLAQAMRRLLPQPAGGESVVFADNGFGLHQLRLPGGAGAYADQGGRIVARWTSQWQRPELWLFDFHHHLFAGDTGEVVIGIAGLCGMFFVVTGLILWWRTRRTFRWRLLPRRLSRPAIITHHRDLGIMVAPLILLSTVTGAAMVFRPVAMIVIAPLGSPAQALAALRTDKVRGSPLAATPPWRTIMTTAARRFPDAVPRVLSLPRREGDPITLRMRRAGEWLPNGRTALAFDAATGRLLSSTDALAMPSGARAYNGLYPVHAGRVGGVVWKLLLTIGGLAMTLLGSLAVWSFWFKRPRARTRPGR